MQQISAFVVFFSWFLWFNRFIVVLSSLYDQKFPLCPNVLKSNVALAQPLCLKIHSVRFHGNACMVFGACIVMPEKEPSGPM